ncbi:MAG: YopX family protein [Candidatus Paceibacterota bacterium]
MREIKFRAYDRKEKKMIPSVGFYDSDCGRILVEESYMLGGGETYNFYDFDVNTQQNRFELMQYTGLKDSTGKEIYEGDIVEYESEDDGYTSKGMVAFNEGCFDVNNSIELYLAYRQCSVIGNIYENPELILKFRGKK